MINNIILKISIKGTKTKKRNQLIQNPNPKSTHIVFINFWAYPETISKWNYQFWFTHFTLCTIICIWCLAKGGLISDGICFRPQNVPNHSPKQNFPPMTLANNLFAQEIDLAPYIGNATKVEIPFEIKPPLSGPSIKDVSSNFNFLTPPTYPCLLFLLNNLISKSPFDGPSYLPLWGDVLYEWSLSNLSTVDTYKDFLFSHICHTYLMSRTWIYRFSDCPWLIPRAAWTFDRLIKTKLQALAWKKGFLFHFAVSS